MRKFGLIGYPLGHSFSKKYFTEKFVVELIEGCSYENYPIPDISQLPVLTAAERDLRGLNVTIPYKSAVIPYLHRIEKDAAEVGAVNVIKISRTGNIAELHGYNSDITGIMATLLPLLGTGIQNALVLGTGGASKAVCYVLDRISVGYTLVSRTRKPGCLSYPDINKEIIDNSRLIINTTPLGMYPGTETSPEIDYSLLDERHLLFDLVYNPEMTLFLKKGQERGCRTVNGMKMLIAQAERSWEIWNDDSL
jgi:shikimate dehydrogenase